MGTLARYNLDVVLVFGGAGYIGSHMAKLLRQQKIPHLVADNLEKGYRQAVGNSDFQMADLREVSTLDSLFTKPIDAVILFAGYTSVGESMKVPGKYFHNNVTGCINLFEAMNRNQCKKLIFSSTAAVYGEPQDIPIPENHPQTPTNPYGESKLAVERIMSWYAKTQGFDAVALRYFNAAGCDPEGEIGEYHDPEEHLIPVAIEANLGIRSELTIFGDDYPTPDGTCIRDYIHVCDLVDAHLLALESLNEAGRFRAYNLGNGYGFSVKQVIDTVGKVAGSPVPHKIGDRRPGDPARLVASSQKAIRELGWEPRYPDLESIVAHTYAWRKKHPNGYDPNF